MHIGEGIYPQRQMNSAAIGCTIESNFATVKCHTPPTGEVDGRCNQHETRFYGLCNLREHPKTGG